MIWDKVLYRANIQYLIDTPIYEYDLSKANINVLRDKNAISEDLYQYLYQAPKLERNIMMGKMRAKNPHLTEILKEGIEEARKFFITKNEFLDSDILSIRNDAITTIGREAKFQAVSERVVFRLAATYTSFYATPNMLFNNIGMGVDFFYFYDPVTKKEVLDTKGLGEADIYHKEYMLDFVSELCYTIQMNGVQMAINLLNNVHRKYINRDMKLGYYRELNAGSMFRLNPSFSIVTPLYTDLVTESDKDLLDISYNENILRFFNRILASIYFK